MSTGPNRRWSSRGKNIPHRQLKPRKGRALHKEKNNSILNTNANQQYSARYCSVPGIPSKQGRARRLAALLETVPKVLLLVPRPPPFGATGTGPAIWRRALTSPRRRWLLNSRASVLILVRSSLDRNQIRQLRGEQYFQPKSCVIHTPWST